MQQKLIRFHLAVTAAAIGLGLITQSLGLCAWPEVINVCGRGGGSWAVRCSDPAPNETESDIACCADDDASQFCIGDLDCDGIVDEMDMLELLRNWGVCDGYCPWDINSDGQVNNCDLMLLLANTDCCSDNYCPLPDDVEGL